MLQDLEPACTALWTSSGAHPAPGAKASEAGAGGVCRAGANGFPVGGLRQHCAQLSSESRSAILLSKFTSNPKNMSL